MISNQVRSAITHIGTLTSRPQAFLIFFAYAGLWLIFDRRSVDWHAIATLATWAMTLFIQRAEQRDTQALHAKLDELLRAIGEADSETARIDDKEPEEIEAQREQKQQDA
ncbi:membrane protein [Mesorhizobium tianshanense]|uniref:Low affinity Fe/Cu permease n=2 Tax=Mesorhizobium tianshanense TaxID=39844 RepID=A0A562NX62_9HYPH|nr:low affinity iron permease family protein [Mesorhizobium tianshanense]TWI36683.1 low affinity Fe/Cu permease [Mesorhizobium tianshanense]GLS38285.1 membrane protein [Mesorhizobium tianshanense]